jgi:hypothetical protein
MAALAAPAMSAPAPAIPTPARAASKRIAAQAAGVPQPATNPYLAQTYNNQGHWNDACTDSTEIAVPRGFYEVTPGSWELVPNETMGIPFYNDLVQGKEVYWFWAGLTMRKLHRVEGHFVEIDRVAVPMDLPGYRGVSPHERVQQAGAVRRFLDAGDEAGLLAYLRAQPNRLMQAVEDQVRHGLLYALLTREHGFIGATARGLIRIDQADPSDPYSRMLAPKQVALPDALFEDERAKRNTIFPTDTVFGLGMSFNGYLVANTIGGRIITLDRNTLQVIDVYTAQDADEVFTNSFATSAEVDGGAVYVASNRRMYRLVVTRDGRIRSDAASGGWQATYDRGIRMPVAKIADGTGSTPTLMGFGPDEDKLVVITDGAKNMRLVAFWRDGIPRGWTPRQPGLDARIADQIEVDMGGGVEFVQSEQSVVAYGPYAFVINNIPVAPRPYLGPGAYYRGLLTGATRPPSAGAAMYRWDATRHAWALRWVRRDVGVLGTVPMISGGSRMVIVDGYLEGRLNEAFHLGMDLDSGQTVMAIASGSDPIFNGSYTGLKVDRDGSLMYTMMFGLVRFDVSRMRRLPGPPQPRAVSQ